MVEGLITIHKLSDARFRVRISLYDDDALVYSGGRMSGKLEYARAQASMAKKALSDVGIHSAIKATPVEEPVPV
jgi:hypothetical protein